MSYSGSCIPSNPDISGIGVRTAIYAQNLLSFGPAIFAILDKKVTPIELDALEQQSTTILITAFAILLSAIVQACSLGLSNFHATIILNLSWINNTNTFIYFLLYAHHRAGLRLQQADRVREGDTFILGGVDVEQQSKIDTIWSEVKKASRNVVLFIGSLHLSLMAAVGIWLWSRPATFGGSRPCSKSASVFILSQRVSLASEGLRRWSLLVYSVVLTPVLNLIIPVLCFIALFLVYYYMHPTPSAYGRSVAPVACGFVVLATINTVLVIDTELAIGKNTPGLLDQGDMVWTFGQTLAILLLLVPIRDISMIMMERQPKRLGKKLLNAAKRGELEMVKDLLDQGAYADAKGEV